MLRASGDELGQDELVAVEAVDAGGAHAGAAQAREVEGVLLEFVD